MKYGLNLVGISLSDVAIARDVFPTHKIIFIFLPRLPDPQMDCSVGCIDFSLMPES